MACRSRVTQFDQVAWQPDMSDDATGSIFTTKNPQLLTANECSIRNDGDDGGLAAGREPVVDIRLPLAFVIKRRVGGCGHGGGRRRG